MRAPQTQIPENGFTPKLVTPPVPGPSPAGVHPEPLFLLKLLAN